MLVCVGRGHDSTYVFPRRCIRLNRALQVVRRELGGSDCLQRLGTTVLSQAPGHKPCCCAEQRAQRLELVDVPAESTVQQDAFQQVHVVSLAF